MSINKQLRIGIISSSGGSVFKEVYDLIESLNLWNIRFYIVSDRECGIEKYAELKNVESHRINENDNVVFSRGAAEYFQSKGGVDFIFLFFTRLVTRDIFSRFPTINVHPSLLPAFKGFNPIKKFIAANGKIFGATVHLVDTSVDGGPILAQTARPVNLNECNEETLGTISFLQKVYLFVVIIEAVMIGELKFDRNNKHISFRWGSGLNIVPFSNRSLKMHRLLELFLELEKREGHTISL